ncbi:MAG TPA: hypothetical protein VG347_13740 [Verrucomicrobiae bacterium]|nr:hypothetical protein [Verrucomicrobiae bacterium]
MQYTFEDGPGTTTASSGALAIPLNMLSSGSGAVDLHGGANSGIQNSGKSLNLSTNPIAGNVGGAFAMAQNNAALGAGLGIVSNFTASVWIKMPVLQTNTLNQGSRVYGLMGTGLTDYGGVNTLGFQPQFSSTATPLFPKFVMTARISTSFIYPVICYNYPTNEWLFFAMTYDSVSGNACMYYGTEASPAKMLIVRNIGAGTNFNFSGTPSFSLGDRPSKGRSFPGWIDDARFYTGAGDVNFIENIRQSSTPVVVAGLTPDGSVLQGGTNTLSFTATSPNGVNASGVKVVVNGADVSSSLNFTATTGGQIVTYTNLPVNPTLITQSLLNGVNVNIKITDIGGIVTSNTYTYDAFSQNNFTWECEDFDFGGGQYIDNPVYTFVGPNTNTYYQEATPYVNFTDASDNGNLAGPSRIYRDLGVGNVETEFSITPGVSGVQIMGELMRQKVVDAYAVTNIAREVNVGYFDFGVGSGLPNWMNYTRTYPTGNFNVFLRVADGGGSLNALLDSVTDGWGTSAQTTTNLGAFNIVNSGGWDTFAWVPLRDGNGNLVRVALSGTNTLRLTASTGGGGNVNFLMLTPANTNLPTISGIYPNGTNMFQPANALTFTANSPGGFTISAAGISVQLTIKTLLGTTIVTNITSTNGLTVTGSVTNRIVSIPLATNQTYTAVISVVDVNGSPASATVSFDTVAPSYTWEAVDYDYYDGTIGGNFIDNPQINGYAGLSGGPEIDFHDGATVSQVNPAQYRNDPVGLELNGDKPRLPYIGTGFIDYDVGYNAGGDWQNYTRTFPVGDYNIFVRAANGSTGLASGVTTLSQVTSGLGTSNQTTVNLGTFTEPSTGSGNWQTYTWAPLRDSGGNLVKFTGGSVKTLRATITAANQNVHFYALFPANTNLPTLTGVNPTSGGIYQSTNTFAFNVASAAGVATNSVVVTINGQVTTNLVFSGSVNNWSVSYPRLQPNKSYTITVSVTDLNGNTAATSSTFDTFSPANYTWEAEDFDHDFGQFIDNPQTNAYFGLPAATDVDTHQVNFNAAAPYLYRNNPLALPGEGNGMATEVNGDIKRSQYLGAGNTNLDYSMGYFSGGANTTPSWANYTRHYPAGSYNVYGRMAAGAAVPTTATLSTVTSGWGTTTQTTNLLGTFSVPNVGWETYTFVPLRDNSGNLITMTFDGSTNTLQLSNPLGSGSDINVNFLMLTPVFALSAINSGTNVALTFPAQSGFGYQVQYKTNLTDINWNALGSAIAGTNGSVSVKDPATRKSRFYRVQIQ